MSDPNLRTLFTGSVLSPALHVAFPKLFAGTFAAVISSVAMLAALWSLVRFIGDFSGQWLSFSVLLWIVAALFAAFSSWWVHDAEARFSGKLRRKIAQHLVRLPTSARHKQDDHALKRLVSDDIATLHHMVAHLPSEIAIFTVIPLLSIGILIATVGVSALWVLLPGCLAALYYLIVVPYISKRDGVARMQVMFDIIAKADDYVRGIRINRIYGQQSGALAAYNKATEYFTKTMVMWVAKVAIFAAIAVALLQAVATFAIAYWLAFQYDTMTLATTLLFSLAIVTPALRLGHGLDYVAAGRAAAGRLEVFLQQPILTSGQMKDLPDHKAALSLVDVTYATEDRNILQNLNFVFPQHSITMVSGISGVGKSTLLRLIAGLEPLKSGKIKVGDSDLADLNAHARHQKILLIPQGMDVLASSVRSNLALSAPDATDQQLLQALTKAQLDVMLDTDAVLLSGGEKQRLNIARVFLTQANIILLDEPTSALDQMHAEKLIQALQELAQIEHKTLLIVSHDPSLLANTQSTLVLQGARNPS